ncbi:MAG: hypothetical protein J6M47_09875 [Clostridia bacterium]|nr:hypothetical protein [Clostridia bacterium]
MTNNEKFNCFINSCSNPHVVMACLHVLAPIFRTAYTTGDEQRGGEQDD